MKRLFTFVCAALLVFGLASCGDSDKEKKEQEKALQAKLQRLEKRALKVGVLPTLDCLPVAVAQKNGFFENITDSFRIKSYNSQMDIDEALKQGKLDVAVCDVKRMELLNKSSQSFVSIGETNGYWLLIVNKSARIKDIRHLGDKMIAMTRFSALDYLTDKVIAEAATSATIFKIQINDVPLRLQMLINNSMDAMWLPEPQATVARELGFPVLKDSRKYETGMQIFCVRKADLSNSQRRAQLLTFVEGYNKACDLLNRQGLNTFAQEIKETCQVPSLQVEKLPAHQFKHLSLPNEQQ